MPVRDSGTFSGIEISPKDSDRFWEKVDVASDDQCWLWKAAINKSGYGSFRIGGKRGKIVMPHRFSAFLCHDKFEPESHYLHSCDNPKCCNPHHLKAGTRDDNMADMAKKKRNCTPRPGNGYLKIDKSKRKEIVDMKRAGVNNCEISRQIGCSVTRVSQICKEDMK